MLRTTLLGSLLDVAQRNRSRGMPDVRLFEIGAVFVDQPRSRAAYPGRGALAAAPRGGPARRGAAHRGAAAGVLARERAAAADFFAAKAVLEAVLGTLRVPWSVEPGSEPFLHPGRTARVLIAGRPAGWIGELHPAVARAWDLEAATAFELDLGVTPAEALHVPQYVDLTSFPAVLQDRAWSFGRDVAAADVVATVREAGGPLLRAVEVFDVYPARGPRVAGAAAAVPRRRPHAHRRGGRQAAREDRRRRGRALGGELRG